MATTYWVENAKKTNIISYYSQENRVTRDTFFSFHLCYAKTTKERALLKNQTKRRKNMLKVTDVIIDPRTLGSKLWLVDVQPTYNYVDGHRTDTITGYRYTVALPEKGLEKINVRIEGAQKLEAPNGFVEVAFRDLELYIYWSQNQPQVGARATDIYLVVSEKNKE